jgi:hypothetical protein
MGKTTNYESWLSTVTLDREEDVYDLYNSISNFEGSGKFYTSKEVTNDGYEYLVKAEGSADDLFLESDEAKFEFLKLLASNHTDAEDGDIQKWYKMKTELGRTD